MVKKILMIEDDFNKASGLKQLLESRGCSTEFAFSSEDILNRISQSRPDLILLDLLVSNSANLEICGHIRDSQSWPRVPVLVYGPKDSLRDIVTAYNLGADYYINREDEGENLLLKLIEVVFTRQKYRENFSYRELGQPASWSW